MERIVRYRLATFFLPTTDPISGAKSAYAKDVYHGQLVTTEAAPEEGGNPNIVYGVPESEIKRVEAVGLNAGDPVFFSDAEIEAMELGVTDSTTGGIGDTETSQVNPTLARDPGAVPSTPHPMAFSEMSVSQIADYIGEADPTPDELVEIVMQTPLGSREEVGNKILAAEAEATEGEAREEVLFGIAEALGRGGSTGPEGSEGVPGTEGQETTGDGSDEPSEAEGGGGTQPETPAEEPPTDSAVALAKEKGVDLDEVTGTGRNQRVTEADVKKYLAEAEQA